MITGPDVTNEAEQSAGADGQFHITVVKQTFASLVAQYSSILASIALTAVLARILSARDFGIFTTVATFTAFFDVLIEIGAGGALVQRSTLRQRELSSVFWAAITVAALCYLLLFGAAPYLALALGIPELTAVLRVLGVNLVFYGALLVPAALLRKGLQFGVLARWNLLALVLSGGIAISMAANGLSYWALAFQGVAVVALRCVGAFRYSGWRPEAVFDAGALRPLLGFSSAASLHVVVNYWGRNLGNLLIARLIGVVPLGQFNLANRLLGLPIQLVSSVLQPLLHPILAAIGSDTKRVRSAYGQIVQLTGILSFAVAAYLWVIADRLVPLLWGAQWVPSVPIFYALVPVAAIQPVNALCAAVFMARDATRLLLAVSTANAVVVVCGMAVGVMWGVEGVAWGYSLTYVLIAAPLATLTAHTRLLGGTLAEYARWLFPPIVAGLCVLAGSWTVALVLPRTLQPLLWLTFVSLVAGASMLAAVRVVAWPLSLRVLRTVLSRTPATKVSSQETGAR